MLKMGPTHPFEPISLSTVLSLRPTVLETLSFIERHFGLRSCSDQNSNGKAAMPSVSNEALYGPVYKCSPVKSMFHSKPWSFCSVGKAVISWTASKRRWPLLQRKCMKAAQQRICCVPFSVPSANSKSFNSGPIGTVGAGFVLLRLCHLDSLPLWANAEAPIFLLRAPWRRKTSVLISSLSNGGIKLNSPNEILLPTLPVDKEALGEFFSY